MRSTRSDSQQSRDVHVGRHIIVEPDAYDAITAEDAVTRCARSCSPIRSPKISRSRIGGARMKFGIVTFPGSNCDYDAFHAVADVLGEEAVYLWHKDHDLQGSRCHHSSRWLQLRRLPPRRRDRAIQPDHAGSRRARKARRAGDRDLQRLSDRLRSGPAPGRAAAQCDPAIHLGAVVTLRVENADTLFTNRYAARRHAVAIPDRAR